MLGAASPRLAAERHEAFRSRFQSSRNRNLDFLRQRLKNYNGLIRPGHDSFRNRDKAVLLAEYA